MQPVFVRRRVGVYRNHGVVIVDLSISIEIVGRSRQRIIAVRLSFARSIRLTVREYAVFIIIFFRVPLRRKSIMPGVSGSAVRIIGRSSWSVLFAGIGSAG